MGFMFAEEPVSTIDSVSQNLQGLFTEVVIHSYIL